MLFKQTKTTLSLLLISALMMTACSSVNTKTSSATAYKEVQQEMGSDGFVIERGLSIEDYLKRQQKSSMQKGSTEIVSESLWNDKYNQGFLFVDHKARRVGDVITVLIVETSSASKSASTKTSRDSSAEGGISSLLGLPSNYGMKNFMGLGQPFSPNYSGGMKNSFTGSGNTSRSDRITATISAEVIDVLPNGNLRVLGHREIKVNEENQIITVAGVIRPADIDENNAVKSTQIAEAQIKYYGDGAIARKQKEGWLTRALEYVWPF